MPLIILKIYKFIHRFSLVTVMAFVGLAIVYGTSTARTATGIADSDEIITAGYLLAPVHPPGYGILVISVFIIQKLLWFLTPAYAANLLSGIFHWATLYFLYKTAEIILSHEYPKIPRFYLLPGVIGLGLSALFWRYASIAEVMPLGNLFTALVMYASFSWFYCCTQNQYKWFLITALVFGLGVSHLQTLILLGPGLLILFFCKLKVYRYKLMSLIKLVVGGFAMTFIGFALGSLVLLPLNSHQPQMGWDFPNSLSGIFRMVFRSDYAGHFVETDKSISNAYIAQANVLFNSVHQIPRYLKFTWNYFNGLWLLTLIPMVIAAVLDRKIPFIGVIVFYAFSGLLLGSYVTIPVPLEYELNYHMSQGIAERQYLIGYTSLGLMTCLGGALILSFFRLRKIEVLYILALSFLCLLFANQNYGNMRLYNSINRTFRKDLMKVERDAVIICSSDTACYSLYQLSLVEKIRPDVTILSYFPKSRTYFLSNNLQYTGYLYNQNPYFYAQLLTWNVYYRPTYISDIDPYYTTYIGLNGDPFYTVPFGHLFRVYANKPQVRISSNHLNMEVVKDERDIYSRGINDYYSNTYTQAGMAYTRFGDTALAKKYFDYALSLDNRDSILIDWAQYTQEYATFYSYSKNVSTSSGDLYNDAIMNFEANKLEESYNQARKSYYLNPIDIKPLKLLTQIYQKIKSNDAARITQEHIDWWQTTNIR